MRRHYLVHSHGFGDIISPHHIPPDTAAGIDAGPAEEDKALQLRECLGRLDVVPTFFTCTLQPMRQLSRTLHALAIDEILKSSIGKSAIATQSHEHCWQRLNLDLKRARPRCRFV